MWAWHIGMVAERGARVYDIGKGFAGHKVPDINHPATKGWLLHMLREARGSGLFVGTQECDDGTWEVRGWSGLLATGSTEGEALAAALLAVWGQAA